MHNMQNNCILTGNRKVLIKDLVGFVILASWLSNSNVGDLKKGAKTNPIKPKPTHTQRLYFSKKYNHLVYNH